jgi:hypothetical protein
MSFWKEKRNDARQPNKSSDTTTMVYTRIAETGVNMLGIIKPSFYTGQLHSLSNDYMSFVEKFLASEDRDWGEYLKFILYIREIGKKLLNNVEHLHMPLNQLIRALEEIYEGESASLEDELEEELEPERFEEPENIEEFLEMTENPEVQKEKPDETEDKERQLQASISREDLARDYDNFLDELRIKLRHAEVPLKVEEALAKEIAEVYQECVQFSRELARLQNMPEGDLATLLSILIDIQYGMTQEMKKHLMEDIVVEERFSFKPGLLTWTAHFLSHFSDKVNQEWQDEIWQEEWENAE